MTVKELYQTIGGDYDAALKIMMMEPIVSKMIVKLLDDKSFGRIRQGGETMDATELFEGAHALKGVAASLGLTRLSEQAGVICDEFRPGRERTRTDEEVRTLLAEIEALYNRTLEGIRAFAGRA